MHDSQTSFQHPTFPERRKRILAAFGIAGAALMATTITSAQAQNSTQTPATAASHADPNLSVNDVTLSARARDLIRIGQDGIAKENPEALARYFHPDFVFHGADGSTATREQLWGFFASYRAAFDNLEVSRQRIFSDGGSYVASQTTFSGIFARPLASSPVGPLQPTGKPFVLKIHNIFRYAPDGRVIEEWVQSDSRLFLQSLGVRLVPAP